MAGWPPLPSTLTTAWMVWPQPSRRIWRRGPVSALRLQVRAFRVTILEERAQPGESARQSPEGGFTFDMGPSLRVEHQCTPSTLRGS